jgi:hypothetical protein
MVPTSETVSSNCLVLWDSGCHLVSQSPILDVIWLFPPMLSPQIGIVSISGTIAILNPSQSFIKSTCPKIQTEIRLYSFFPPFTENFQPMHEFVRA